MRNPYEVLGVAKGATAKDIKSAYRRLAKKHHPDQNPNDAKAKDRFADLNQAYEILGDEKSRGAFDRGEIGEDGKPKYQGFEGAPGGGDPFGGFRQARPGAGNGSRFGFRASGDGAENDIFSEIFGQAFSQRPGAASGGGQRGPVGADINASLDITIEEAASAAKVMASFPDGRKIAVKLPAYVEDGQTIRLKGQGEQSYGEPGDALVKIRFRHHPRYRVDGRNLHADLPVPLRDAVLGAKIAVDTPMGKLALNVPAWSSSDKVLRLKGRGLPEKGGGHADLYAHVRVMLPEGGDAELEALMKKAGR